MDLRFALGALLLLIATGVQLAVSPASAQADDGTPDFQEAGEVDADDPFAEGANATLDERSSSEVQATDPNAQRSSEAAHDSKPESSASSLLDWDPLEDAGIQRTLDGKVTVPALNNAMALMSLAAVASVVGRILLR
jgi:hypothetical protein